MPILPPVSNDEHSRLSANLENPYEHFEIVDLLGRGSFGNVVKVRNIHTDEIYAAKQIILTEKSRRRSEREMQIMKTCSGHSNMLEFYGAFIDFKKSKSGCLWLVMENCAGGSVRSVILQMSQRSFKEHWIRYVLKNVLKALAFLHSKLIVHRDIKGDNIMFTTRGLVKLVDFGLSIKLASPSEKLNTLVGTIPWMAPETMLCTFPDRKSWYNTKADIWSLGITIFEMATGNAPWLIDESMIKLVVDKTPPKLSSDRSKEMRNFTKRCLTKKPSQRPTAEKLQRDHFITNFDTDDEATFEIRSVINLIDDGVSSPDLMIRSSVISLNRQKRKSSKSPCVIS